MDSERFQAERIRAHRNACTKLFIKLRPNLTGGLGIEVWLGKPGNSETEKKRWAVGWMRCSSHRKSTAGLRRHSLPSGCSKSRVQREQGVRKEFVENTDSCDRSEVLGGDERFLEKVLEFLLEQSRTCFGDTELFPPWLVMTYEKAEDAFSLDWKHLLFTVFLYKVTIKEYFF